MQDQPLPKLDSLCTSQVCSGELDTASQCREAKGTHPGLLHRLSSSRSQRLWVHGTCRTILSPQTALVMKTTRGHRPGKRVNFAFLCALAYSSRKKRAFAKRVILLTGNVTCLEKHGRPPSSQANSTPCFHFLTLEELTHPDETPLREPQCWGLWIPRP